MISVIMPVFNSEKYINDSVSSVLNQTYSNFELIIVNDGSTDDSLEIISSIASKDKRIRIINIKNSGPSYSRNIGIKESKGDWIYFMDSDDYIEPNMFDEMVNFGENKEIIICGFYKHYIRDEQNEIVKKKDLENISINSLDVMRKYLIKCSYKIGTTDIFLGYLWNKLISAQLIRENHLKFQEDVFYGEDLLFLCEVYKFTTNIRIISSCYYHYIVRDHSSLSRTFYPEEIEIRRKMYLAKKGLYIHYDIYNDCISNLENETGQSALVSLKKINSSACNLSKEEKIKYITSFIDSEMLLYMENNLKNTKSIRNFIKLLLLQTKNSKLIYCFLNITKK